MVTQITRTGEFNIAGSPRLSDSKRAGGGGFGGISLWDASPGGVCHARDLQVDSSYVYTMASWGAAGSSKVYRIDRSSFEAGKSNDQALINGATIENTAGITGGSVQTSGFALVNGRLTVCGQFGGHGLSFKITGSATAAVTLAHVGTSNLFVATLTADFSSWENQVVIPEAYVNTTQPTYAFRQTALTRANLDGSNLILASRFTAAGDAKFDTNTTYGGENNAFGLLLSSETNKLAVKRFILDVEADGKEPNGTKTVGITGLTDVGITPGFGIRSADAGNPMTVTFPEHIYQKADGSFLKPAEVTEANIQGPDVVARYRPSGYTLTRDGDQQTEIGTGNSVAAVMTKNTNITFHLIREYALTVSSNLANLPGVNPVSDQTLGDPVPECKKSWIEENTQMTAEISGTVVSQTDLGTRYLCTGYVPTGVLGTTDVSFAGTTDRQTTKQFTMTGPASITYQWKSQHSITTNSSAPAGGGLPGLKHPAGVLTGSGVYWFDRGAEITVGATDGADPNLALKGVMSATGALADLDQKTRAELPSSGQFVDGGKTYRGLKVAKLEAGGTVVWDFGSAVYQQFVALGSPVRIAPGSGDFAAGDELTQAFADIVDLTIAPKVVSVVNSPPGTTADNAMRWSKFDQKEYPVRPGRYLLEWTTKTSGKLTTEITVGFPGDTVRHPYFDTNNLVKTYPGAVRNLRALVHPKMPAIDLDPDATDDTAFKELSFSATVNTNLAKVEDLTAPKVAPVVANPLLSIPVTVDTLNDGEGKHVLVFSRRAGKVPATGDLDKESLVVRVLETRRWDAEKKWEPTEEPNRVLSLNGSDAFLQTALKNLSGNELTIQYWFKGTNSQSAVRQQRGSEHILAPWKDLRLGVSTQSDPLGAGSIRLANDSAGTYATDANWHLITMTWRRNSSDGFKGYLDGVSVGSKVTPDVALPNLDTEVIFGAFVNALTGAPSEFASGSMDEISIWNRALSEWEISAYKNTMSETSAFKTTKQVAGTEANLVGYWNFDDRTAVDLTGHGFDGILRGGATVVEDISLKPAPLEDVTGDKMVASANAPIKVDIGVRIRDGILDRAGIGTGFVTGAKARYNVDLHDNAKVGDAGPVFPVNRVFAGTADDDLTVIWYERKDGVLWPWRPRKFEAQWPTNPLRIVIASQLGSDGLSPRDASSRYNPQPWFDPAGTSGLKVYVQNDSSLPGFNPNEEHALAAGSLKFAAAVPQPDAVYALRYDLNVTDPSANYTSEPFVLAEYTNTVSGQPEMAVYKVEASDSSAAAPYQLDCRSLSKDGSDVVFNSSSLFLQEEPVLVRVTAGSLEGVSSGQTLYTISTGSALKLSRSPGGPAITTTAASLSSVNVTLIRLYPYDFKYRATAGLPVPFPNPLTSVIGAVPPGEISGGEEVSFTSVNFQTPKVYFEDYKGLPWAISGGPPQNTDGAQFYTRFFYRMQDSFWHKRKADKTKAGTTDPGTQTPAGTPIRHLVRFIMFIIMFINTILYF